ncbi:transcription termination factor 3, mitochondrial [Aplysia californica]|uniref:Transcription termination factor 3, mitochondrial n=1 Tax=Aplysia californica TaxID=6500 RepID=A0ABM0JQC7_APLCA|nr:transcription termination factor 3, mitochondrial [Aplysia californica]
MVIVIRNLMQTQCCFLKRVKLLLEVQMMCRALHVHRKCLPLSGSAPMGTSLQGHIATKYTPSMRLHSSRSPDSSCRLSFRQANGLGHIEPQCWRVQVKDFSIRCYSRGSRRGLERKRREADVLDVAVAAEQVEGNLGETEGSALAEYADDSDDRLSIDLTTTSQDSSVDLHSRPAADLSVPELSRRAMNLVPFVNRSETLQKLVQLGVDLSVVQQVEGMSTLLVRSDFERDIMPYIRFLADVGVPADRLGHVLTVNPHILTEDRAELEQKIGYLVHKKFSLQEVARMVCRAPVMLLMSPQQMDQKLGFLQQTFGLSGPEVRLVAVKYPKILPYKKDKIALTRFQVKGFLGFSDVEMKEILLKEPRIFMTENRQLVSTFDYLHNTMLIPHRLLLTFPGALTHSPSALRTRHLFLLARHRAQYDPCLENYVSLKALVSGTDDAFCADVVKCGVQEFYDFIKTL